MDKRVSCDRCEGDGLVVVDWDEHAYENIEGPCPDCGGSGELVLEEGELTPEERRAGEAMLRIARAYLFGAQGGR